MGTMGPRVVSTVAENSRAAKAGVRGQHQAGEALWLCRCQSWCPPGHRTRCTWVEEPAG